VEDPGAARQGRERQLARVSRPDGGGRRDG
jgi:hypothetical protein